MFHLTLTLRGTTFQPVLVFDDLPKARAAQVELKDRRSEVKMIEDDHGHELTVCPLDVVWLEISDVKAHWAYVGKRTLIKLRAETEMDILMSKDPTLAPLVGGRHPKFGG